MEELEMHVEKLEQHNEVGNLQELADYLNELNISDVEELIDELLEDGSLFRETFDLNRSVNVFRILASPTQERMFKRLSANNVREILNEMAPDDRTSFFGELKGG